MPRTEIAVLATLDSKTDEVRFFRDALAGIGVSPWVMDLSLRPHENDWGAVSGDVLAQASGTVWPEIAEMSRADAAEVMVTGGIKILRKKFKSGTISGVIGIGGANGSTMACAMMRALPPLLPKGMITPVAATPVVQWHVAQSDIVMFPTIGDISLNRITKAVMDNAAHAIAAMARAWQGRTQVHNDRPLVGISTFGNLQEPVDRISEHLSADGFEVIQFHASGPGGKALEHLASIGELTGVVDFTTSELTDLLTGGVYSAGDGRLRAAGAAGLAQVIVPGSIDFTNWWVGEIPDRYKNRAFHHYSVENLLMRTNAEEYAKLGEMMAERLNDATGPFAVLIPKKGFSQQSNLSAQDLDGNDLGPWFEPDFDLPFTNALKKNLKRGRIDEFDLHINDPEFADACISAFTDLMKQRA